MCLNVHNYDALQITSCRGRASKCIIVCPSGCALSYQRDPRSLAHYQVSLTPRSPANYITSCMPRFISYYCSRVHDTWLGAPCYHAGDLSTANRWIQVKQVCSPTQPPSPIWLGQTHAPNPKLRLGIIPNGATHFPRLLECLNLLIAFLLQTPNHLDYISEDQ